MATGRPPTHRTERESPTTWTVVSEPREIYVTSRVDAGEYLVIDEDVYDETVVSKETTLEDAIEVAKQYGQGQTPG